MTPDDHELRHALQCALTRRQRPDLWRRILDRATDEQRRDLTRRADEADQAQPGHVPPAT